MHMKPSSQTGLRLQEWAGIWRIIFDRWGAPLEAAAEVHQHGAETEASASDGHALDLQLRRMLADALANIDKKDDKARAAQILNARRKHLLHGQGTDLDPLPSEPTAYDLGRAACRHCSRSAALICAA